MLLMASSIAPFHSLCQNDWNEVQPDCLVMYCHWHWHKQHVIPLHCQYHHCICYVKWLKWGATWLFWSCHAIDTDVGIKCYHQHCQRNHYIPYIKQSKWTMTFWSCDTIAIATTCHWCWCHMMLLASVSVLHDAYSIINGTIILFGLRW